MLMHSPTVIQDAVLFKAEALWEVSVAFSKKQKELPADTQSTHFLVPQVKH